MKFFRHIHALSLVIISFFLTISCSKEKQIEEQKSIIDKICISGEATAISLSPDSSALFIGFNENYFIEYDRKNHTSIKFELPEKTNSTRTYQIKELRNSDNGREFLASKRNSGVLWLKYDSQPDSDNIFRPSKCVYISSENSGDAMPQKGQNYSTYKIVEGRDSTLYFATSNGMMYLTQTMLTDSVKRSETESTISAPYLPSLRPMRQNRMQFSNEDVFVDNHSDKLIAVTDSGIYRLSADYNSPNYEKLLTNGRFKASYMGNDTLWAVATQPEGAILFTITNPYSDNFKISTKAIDSDCKIINKKIFGYGGGNIGIGDNSFNLGLEVIGRESLQVLNDDMYYISEDAVCYVNLNLLTKINDTAYSPIKTAVKGEDSTFYLLTGKALYAYNANNANCEYLGDVYDLPSIKDAIWHNENIYMCDDNSVYTLSTAHSLFAFDRKVERIEEISVKSPDKIESLGIDADKGLYVGSRSGLSLYGFDGSINPINVNIKKFDSPYLTDIAEGGEYASTLNYGLLGIGNVAESVSGYDNYRDIRSVDKCGEYLCFNTPTEVVAINLTAHKTIGGKSIKCKNIIDAGFIDANTIGILTTDSILQYSISSNSLIKKSAKKNQLGYQQLFAHNAKDILISKYPIANNTPIIAQNLSWSEVIYIILSFIVAIAISIYIIFYIIKLKRRHKFNISRLRHRHSSEITLLSKNHNEQIAQINKSNDERISQLNKYHEDQISQLNKCNDEQIAQLNTSHGEQISQLNKNHDEQMSQLNTSHNEQIAQLNRSHKEQISQLNKSYDDQISQLNKCNDEQMSLLNKSNNEQISQLNKSHEEQMSQLNKKHNEQISQLNKSHDEQIAQLNTSHGEQIAQLNKSHDEQISQLSKSHKERERNITLDFDLHKSYTISATKLIKHISTIYSNYEIYHTKEESLNNLKDVFDKFKKSVSPLLAKEIEVSDIKKFKEAYDNLYIEFANWLNLPNQKEDKTKTKEDENKEDKIIAYNRCRYGMNMLNICGFGIRALIEKPNEESKTKSEKAKKQEETERDASWELFTRYVISGEESSEIINNILENMDNEKLELHYKKGSGWKKLLKERISQKNVGAIINLLWSNLSADIWKNPNSEPIAQTPYDVMWNACKINSHTNDLLDELKKADEILSKKTTKHS